MSVVSPSYFCHISLHFSELMLIRRPKTFHLRYTYRRPNSASECTGTHYFKKGIRKIPSSYWRRMKAISAFLDACDYSTLVQRLRYLTVYTPRPFRLVDAPKFWFRQAMYRRPMLQTRKWGAELGMPQSPLPYRIKAITSVRTYRTSWSITRLYACLSCPSSRVDFQQNLDRLTEWALQQAENLCHVTWTVCSM